jgi:hypothetical protein
MIIIKVSKNLIIKKAIIAIAMIAKGSQINIKLGYFLPL